MRILTLILLLLGLSLADAKWDPKYAQVSPEVQNWYKTRQLTPEAQTRFPFKSCCDGSDVVVTRFRATVRGDVWFYMRDGDWVQVPDDIIHWDEHSPTGEAVLFVLPTTQQPTCFFPPQGGG